MDDFLFNALPHRVRFERGGRRHVGDEMVSIGRERAMVLSTPGRRAQTEEVQAALAGKCVGVLATARMHSPVEVTEAAMDVLAESGADCTVAVGGGSVIGLGKAIVIRADIPQIALPTTYAGSEMTMVLGQTKDGVKTTSSDPRMLPVSVIYDVDYTLSLPPRLSATSGINAIAHAIEALYAREKNPVSTMQCLEAIRVLVEALPTVVQEPGNVDARSHAAYGAFLCGMALGSAGMALHHKLCHALGGSFDLPHADTHTVMLPHAAGFNAVETRELDPVKKILGAESIGGGLWDFAKRMGAPTSLKEIGMPKDGIERAADVASANPYWNPRSFDRDDIKALIEQAYAGERPKT